MKKALSLLLAAVLLTASLAIVANAGAQVSGDVKHGTPLVDGVLDEIYLTSGSFTNDAADGHFCTTGVQQNDITSQIYMLWDEEYFYLCAVVNDAEVIDCTAARYENAEFTWMSDAVEFMFQDGVTTDNWKFHMESHGHGFYFGENRALAEMSWLTPAEGYDNSAANFKLAEGTYKFETSLTDTGYIVELAVPFFALSAGTQFLAKAQICDLTEYRDGYAENAIGPYDTPLYTTTSNSYYSFTMVAEDVGVTPGAGNDETDPVIDETDPVIDETDPAETDPTEDIDPDDAPQTFDVITISAITAVVSLLGYQLTKKRR